MTTQRVQLWGDFNGWDDRALFVLSDGRAFIQAEYQYSYMYSYMPMATLENGNRLLFDGMNSWVAVTPVECSEHTIVSEFSGWNFGNLFQFENGQVWKQTEHEYDYNYEHRPTAFLVNGNLLYVDGCSGPVEVVRVR